MCVCATLVLALTLTFSFSLSHALILTKHSAIFYEGLGLSGQSLTGSLNSADPYSFTSTSLLKRVMRLLLEVSVSGVSDHTQIPAPSLTLASSSHSHSHTHSHSRSQGGSPIEDLFAAVPFPTRGNNNTAGECECECEFECGVRV